MGAEKEYWKRRAEQAEMRLGIMGVLMGLLGVFIIVWALVGPVVMR